MNFKHLNDVIFKKEDIIKTINDLNHTILFAKNNYSEELAEEKIKECNLKLSILNKLKDKEYISRYDYYSAISEYNNKIMELSRIDNE